MCHDKARNIASSHTESFYRDNVQNIMKIQRLHRIADVIFRKDNILYYHQQCMHIWILQLSIYIAHIHIYIVICISVIVFCEMLHVTQFSLIMSFWAILPDPNCGRWDQEGCWGGQGWWWVEHLSSPKLTWFSFFFLFFLFFLPDHQFLAEMWNLYLFFTQPFCHGPLAKCTHHACDRIVTWGDGRTLMWPLSLLDNVSFYRLLQLLGIFLATKEW